MIPIVRGLSTPAPPNRPCCLLVSLSWSMNLKDIKGRQKKKKKEEVVCFLLVTDDRAHRQKQKKKVFFIFV